MLSQSFYPQLSIPCLSRRAGLSGMVCALIVAGSGCGRAPPTARQALIAAKAFIDALLALDDVSKVFQGHVVGVVHSTKRNLATVTSGGGANIDLSQVALDWEEKWKAVSELVTALEKQFSEVKAKSDKYWQILDDVTLGIGDSEVRKAEEKKNKKSKEMWDGAYAAAEKNIKLAAAIKDKGSDVHKVMLAAALRRQLAEYTSTLDSIAREAEALLKSLEVLTVQGRSLVNVNSLKP